MRFPTTSLALARALRGPRRSAPRRGSSTGGGPPQRADASEAAIAPAPVPTKTRKEITREHDEARYGDWKAAEILFSEASSPGVVGRLDWHLWQLVVALMPAGVACCIAAWARGDMQRHFGGGQLSFTNKHSRGPSLIESVEETGSSERRLESREQALEKRVAQLERQLSSLQAGTKTAQAETGPEGGVRSGSSHEGDGAMGRGEDKATRAAAPGPGAESASELLPPPDGERPSAWADGARRAAGGAWRGLQAAGRWLAGSGGRRADEQGAEDRGAAAA